MLVNERLEKHYIARDDDNEIVSIEYSGSGLVLTEDVTIEDSSIMA